MSPEDAVPGAVAFGETGQPMPTASAARITLAVTDALLDSEAGLERALVAIERRNDARQAAFAWANIGECNRRLSHYLTAAYPDRRGRSLLVNTLDEAFRAYDCAEPGEERAPVRAYLHALLGCASRILAFDLFCRRSDGRTLRWAPFAEAVTDWVRVEGATELIFDSAHAARLALSQHECVRWMLCARVLRFEDAALLHDDPGSSVPAPVPPRVSVSYIKRVK